MRDWLRALQAQLRLGVPVVRVVVASVRGSAPREPGACMLVTPDGERGTIGGGHLEFVGTRIARDMLQRREGAPRLDRFSLGASLGQCCGGIVELWFQRYDDGDLPFITRALEARARGETSGDAGPMPYEVIGARDTDLWLFGAGHVGQALVQVLAPLPFAITWLDSREKWCRSGISEKSTPTPIFAPRPADEVGGMTAGAWALVMTHSHDEDFDICRALLGRGDTGWIGLIGSAPKATRFRQRLRQRGVGENDIARLVTPIGIAGIASKEPAAIAVAVAAQLLQLREARQARTLAPATRVAQ